MDRVNQNVEQIVDVGPVAVDPEHEHDHHLQVHDFLRPQANVQDQHEVFLSPAPDKLHGIIALYFVDPVFAGSSTEQNFKCVHLANILDLLDYFM
jgi:hypothetical protein